MDGEAVQPNNGLTLLRVLFSVNFPAPGHTIHSLLLLDHHYLHTSLLNLLHKHDYASASAQPLLARVYGLFCVQLELFYPFCRQRVRTRHSGRGPMPRRGPSRSQVR